MLSCYPIGPDELTFPGVDFEMWHRTQEAICSAREFALAGRTSAGSPAPSRRQAILAR
jgi:hypothetical protein